MAAISRPRQAIRDPEVQCLIVTGGLEDCFDTPEELIDAVAQGEVCIDGFQAGWMIWPSSPIPTTRSSMWRASPRAAVGHNWLGTDDTKRDVVARVIYGFRLSIVFALIVTAGSSMIGIVAGAVQGYFGGWIDLVFQRFIEIWTGCPRFM